MSSRSEMVDSFELTAPPQRFWMSVMRIGDLGELGGVARQQNLDHARP